MKKASRNAVLLLLSLAVIIGCAVFVSGLLDQRVNRDRQQLLEESIRNYAVQCYALEGEYPKDLKYLEDNYTLDLNRDKYVYHYKFIGSNLVPEISVFEKER
ncbi:hypothetical protein NE619_12280 [Anaerovorax odorimutans]|uniref:DUF3139 domain-containing protein n=1 Tax=Anaerovorax odorimutans TaxID=109327 RepID=A0ABT1RQN7_9FIRM|nr:hypothetical protein [Anaerovorax odorimutans]MCQ4637505.1 hypothetical protein [Anaerovorax odorimutans]